MGVPSEVHQQILGYLQSVLIFDRLTEDEIKKIYGICTFRRFAADETIYKFGAPSEDFFVLLDGRLVARANTGVDIAYIPPVGVVGEMGLITDQPRSANVLALEDAMGFQITKKDLLDLFIADSAICRKILLNLVKVLSNKLYETNAEIEKLREEQAKGTNPHDQSDNIFLY